MQTKPELVLALVDQARAWSVPFASVIADAGYGDNPTFLQGLDDRPVAYVVGISSTFGVRLPEEVHTAALVLPSHPRGRGQPQKPPYGVKRLRLCFPQAISSRKLQRDSRFHYLCGYLPRYRVVTHRDQPDCPFPPQANLTK